MTDLDLAELMPPGLDIWEHQGVAVDHVFRRWDEGDKSTLLLMPTGTGKTITVGLMLRVKSLEAGWKALFLAQRRKLVDQAADTFRRFGLVTAVEMADQRERSTVAATGAEPEVVVATVQTLSGERLLAMDPGRFDAIVIDEAHHSLGVSYHGVLGHFKDYRLLGVTATPDGAKRNLGCRFRSIAYQFRVRDAIERGVLVPVVRDLVQTPVDLKGLRVKGGDYGDADLAARILPAIEGIAFNLKDRIGLRPTVAFTADLASAAHLAAALRAQDVAAKYVAGSAGHHGMTEAEKDGVLGEFEAGTIQVVVSCDLLTEGWDCPKVSCVAICRPTLQRWKYAQMAGRALRICEGKEDALLVDFDWRGHESSKRLCTALTLFTDGVSEEALARAERRLRERPHADVLAELREAERAGRFFPEVTVPFTGKYARRWESVESDPVGVGKVLRLPIRRGKEMNPDYGGGECTAAQQAALAGLGVAHAWGMSKWGASKLIARLRAREARGLASHQQVRELVREGVEHARALELSGREAATILARRNPERQRRLWED